MNIIALYTTYGMVSYGPLTDNLQMIHVQLYIYTLLLSVDLTSN
jgi:hypothetical protein